MSDSTHFDAKEQVRAACDIVDVLSGYLHLRSQGRGYVALCPWHDDTRPSMQINPQRQSWRCWVCGIGGDIFSFVMKREGIEFREALELLAERANIQLNNQKPAAPAGSPDDKKTLFGALSWAERLFHEFLLHDPTADIARAYLQDRGISRDSIQRFQLGFSPNQWQWMCEKGRGSAYSQAVLEKVGLIGLSQKSAKPYDRFKGRVIFPIRDPQSRPIGFGGRILPQLADEKSAKYVNSPETRLFSKSEHVYALDLARDTIVQTGEVIVVEGYTDVIAMHQAGVKNVVAVLGTALGAKHIRLLRRYADKVYLVLDGDEAGQRRTNEVLELFIAQQVDLRVVKLPNEQDPCDFVQQQGPEQFRECLAKSVDALEHKIRVVTAGIDLGQDIHQANDALEDVLNTLAKSPHALTGTTSDVRLREHQFLARMARQFQVDEMELRNRLASLRKVNKKPQPSIEAAQSIESAEATKTYAAKDLDRWDRMLLQLLVAHPELLDAVIDEIGLDEIISEPAKEIYSVYRELAMANSPCDFTSVLTELPSEKLKYLLIDLDEHRHSKSTMEPEEELKAIIGQYHKRHDERLINQQMSELEPKSQTLSDQEQLDILSQIIEQQKNRQGISSTTEG
ncbi:MAG: DNA primase [Pirellulaceae bacterium]